MITLAVLVALGLGLLWGARSVRSASRDITSSEDRMIAMLLYGFVAVVGCATGLFVTAAYFDSWRAPLAGLLLGALAIIVAERSTRLKLIPKIAERARLEAEPPTPTKRRSRLARRDKR